MTKEYYARPGQTYKEHIEMAYEAWKETIKAKRGLLTRMGQLYRFETERFLKGSLLTVVLHDMGKMLESFQQMMCDIKEHKRVDYRKNYRHELVSFLFVMAAISQIEAKPDYSQWPLEALAVAGHHKALNTDLISFEKELKGICNLPSIDLEGLKIAISLAQKIFHQQGWELPYLNEKIAKKDGAAVLSQMINCLPQFARKEDIERARTLYLLTKGVLHYVDWYSSAGVQVRYNVETDVDTVIKKLHERCREKGIPFVGLRPFQKHAASHKGHLVAIAPTGNGKTEGSLFWAINNAKELGRAKIIYLLPTMATANSIWQRMTDIFGTDNVGLTHSTANLLFDKEENDEIKEVEYRKQVLFDQSFMKPVTVATVDQLLTAGFNTGRWVLKEINAANAAIVVDEVHAYDGWTLGLLNSTLQRLVKWGSRIMLMSATLPIGLRTLFAQSIPGLSFYEDKSLLNARRSKYYVHDCLIEEAERDIRTAVNKGYRVLVVVNTVEKCQRLAKQLKDLSPICLHSRFILRDRKKLENIINKARLAVATQVVEVALDIDYDWLFTECAPPDAVIQRAGRVNRYRDKYRDSRVYIFRADEKSHRIYDPINDPELLVRSFAAFQSVSKDYVTEQELLIVLEKVYQGIDFEGCEGYRDALCQYEISQNNRFGILDSRMTEEEAERTRLSKYETISIVPACFFQELKEALPKERKWYEVKVPYWYFLQHKKLLDGMLFCDIKYDPYYGGFLEPDDSFYGL
ncbi:MAG: CRISPR-associated helicase Cas3' [Peptococcaceae bacterium]|jgi:CRISPR-associated endonuclease/helicase Cas3|nr:CRISPR-associated helicase Cas3' [Peptococcaceae bacterium]